MIHRDAGTPFPLRVCIGPRTIRAVSRFKRVGAERIFSPKESPRVCIGPRTIRAVSRFKRVGAERIFSPKESPRSVLFIGFAMAGIMEMMQWGDWRVTVALVVVALVTLYFYLTSNMNYWSKRGFPQIPASPIPIFGNTFKILTGQANFTEMFDQLYKKAGDQPFVGFFQGSQPVLLVKDPELIKRILIKDFHAFMDRGFKIEEDVDPFNAKGLSNLNGQRWKNMRARLSPTFTSGRMKAMFPLMYSCSDVLLNCIENEVKKNSGEVVMEMKDCLSCFSTDVIATCAFGIQYVSWANVDLDDLAAQAMLFFAAGLETTSSLSSFVLFELSKSEEGKEIQRNLQEEVDSVMQEDGGKITYAGLKRMQLLERVVNETLRIHPPAGVLSRIAVENYKIPETDLTLEKNTMVFIPTQAMQNDEKFFPEPKKFNPDRFLNKENYNHFAYLPFGDGPRLCIGKGKIRFDAGPTGSGCTSLQV
ncbi:hypothetical protein J437_LFUL009388 [Ladona fulva]|uniref:Cytochrome P450 n=1 Tax=Ladona fulva TaxID=123851 RepID=A0A8K0K5F7_LADFU|nr:hypothetical protein J437_LFUL009388 [Ladona fulva]